MCRLCLASERSFLRNLRPFLKKKKSKKSKVAFFDFFWDWDFQAMIVAIFQGIQAKKKKKKIENGNLVGKSQFVKNVMFDPKLEISKVGEFIIHMPYV
jgi:hypothetical protein